MYQFYCPELNTSSSQTHISDQKELHHLRHVLRHKKGDVINLFNGNGLVALGKIEAISKEKINIKIQTKKTTKQQDPRIILACAVPKRGKFDNIIEKATELGTDEIIPLQTERTEVILTPEKQKLKNKRYNTIAVNATKQCNRSHIPTIHPAAKLKSVLQMYQTEATFIMPSLLGKNKNLLTVTQELKKPKKIVVLIGPEGDFTKEEYHYAYSSGCIPVNLGQTILKVETASLVAVSLLNLAYKSS